MLFWAAASVTNNKRGVSFSVNFICCLDVRWFCLLIHNVDRPKLRTLPLIKCN